jgi:hypothetical protein
LPATLSDGEAPSDKLRLLYQHLVAKSRDDRPPSTGAVHDVLHALATDQEVDIDALFSGTAPEPMPSKRPSQEASDTIASRPSTSGTDSIEVVVPEAAQGRPFTYTTSDHLDAEVSLPRTKRNRLIFAGLIALIIAVVVTVRMFTGDSPSAQAEPPLEAPDFHPLFLRACEAAATKEGQSRSGCACMWNEARLRWEPEEVLNQLGRNSLSAQEPPSKCFFGNPNRLTAQNTIAALFNLRTAKLIQQEFIDRCSRDRGHPPAVCSCIKDAGRKLWGLGQFVRMAHTKEDAFETLVRKCQEQHP